MMKKNITQLHLYFLLICSVLVLGGCVNTTKNIPYVSFAPPEKTCTLKIVGTLTVKQFNGKEVEWAAGFGDSWASVQIPEGSHTFVLDYERSVYDGRQYQSGIIVSYDNFIAGHTYQMVAAAGAEAGGFSGLFTNMIGAMHDTVNQTLRIGIRDITNKQEVDFGYKKEDFEWLPIKNK